MGKGFILTLIAAAGLSLAGCDTTTAPGDTGASAPVSPAPPPVSSKPEVATGGMCGGIAGLQCGSSKDYCKQPAGECRSVADGAGTCTVKPEVCTLEYNPVCGCDGKTYGNACGAAVAGVSVAAAGECPKE